MCYSLSEGFVTHLKIFLNLNYICLVAIIYEDSVVSYGCCVAGEFK